MRLRKLATRFCKRWRIIFRIPRLIILRPKQVICLTKDDIRNYCGFFYSKCSRPNRLKATRGDSHFRGVESNKSRANGRVAEANAGSEDRGSIRT